MGANIEILNKHEALVNGPTSLKGAQIESLDLRAGATLVIAGLAANGKTIIEEAQIVDRGYEKIEERLQKLGAQITREL
jgi:UDP-N-acetylglucosamine 1-carboxyvinyltransferase